MCFKEIKNEFFREATLRLYSNLDIEKGLCECVSYLTKFMPADGLYLQKVEKEYNAFRIMVRATPEKGETVDILAPLPREARDAITQLENDFKNSKLPTVIVVNNPKEEPITSVVQKYLEVPPSSVLSMPLAIEGRVPATLALIAEGSNRYTEEHVKLFEVLKEPFFFVVSNNLKHKEIIKLKNLLEDDNKYYQDQLQKLSGDVILGADFGLKEVMQMVRQVAPLASSVLILGETGTGKEVIAGAIHNLSPRREKPFIKVNCGAIPDSLMDSELFGHEKGAFTGAISKKRGRFERAHGGTIFLDEIGELPAEAQVRLLRVLQEKKIERLGGTDSIDVDIRIIAATHRDLPEMVKAGKFREDLYFRLKVFPIEIPPLRERIGDIPALVQHVIQLKASEMKLGSIPTIKNGEIEKLMTYAWPGNVRELENIIERALIIRKNDEIEFSEFETKKIPSRKTKLPLDNQDTLELDKIVSEHIRKVLKITNGKIEGKQGAAELLKVNPATLRNRMRKLGIEFGRKRNLNSINRQRHPKSRR